MLTLRDHIILHLFYHALELDLELFCYLSSVGTRVTYVRTDNDSAAAAVGHRVYNCTYVWRRGFDFKEVDRKRKRGEDGQEGSRRVELRMNK